MQNEIVSHDIDHSASIANFYSQNEKLTDPAQRREYFATLDSSDFIGLLQQANSLIRSGDPDLRQPFDGQNVLLSTHAVPDQPDKEQLLRDTWETARKFLDDPKMEDEDALIYAGLTVGGGTLMVHPFIDSNGRTSRVVSHMMINGQGEGTTEEVRRILDEHGGRAWQVTPLSNSMQPYISYKYEKSADLPAKIDWGNDFLETDSYGTDGDPIKRLSETFGNRGLHMFMLNADEKAQAIIKKHIVNDEDGKPLQLDAKTALTELVHDPEGGIGYAAQLDEVEKWARADNVRRFLRSMRDDSRLVPAGIKARIDMLQTKPNSLNDYEQAEVAAFGRLAVDGGVSARDHSRIIFAPSGINLTRNQRETKTEP